MLCSLASPEEAPEEAPIQAPPISYELATASSDDFHDAFEVPHIKSSESFDAFDAFMLVKDYGR